jgi:transcriptional regulator of acetoin/glycerol metabolism
MNFYRVKSFSTLHGFNDPIGNCPILGKDLRVIQEELVTSIGGNLIEIDSEENISDTHCFIFSEDLFFYKSFHQKSLSRGQKFKKLTTV